MPSGGAGPGGEQHPKAVTVLVLGILSLACCGLLGPVAWVMGNNVVREIDSMPGRFGNRSIANAGRICGIVGTAFLVLSIVVLVSGRTNI